MNKIIAAGATVDVDAAVAHYKATKQSVDLDERYAAIFEEKFGIKDGIEKTYKEVGLAFGISAERARQLCAKVLYAIGLLK